MQAGGPNCQASIPRYSKHFKTKRRRISWVLSEAHGAIRERCCTSNGPTGPWWTSSAADGIQRWHRGTTKIFRQHGMVHWNSLQKIPYKKILADSESLLSFRIWLRQEIIPLTFLHKYIKCSNGLASFDQYQALRHGVEGSLSQPQPLPGRTTGASASQIQFTQFLDLAQLR